MNILGIMFFLSGLSLSCTADNDDDTNTLKDNVVNIQCNGELSADGNDDKTYDLITSSGYNYETPDKSGNHAMLPFRHIRQSFDKELQKYVFDFILHIDNDDDRGIPKIKDRQRNEIKTDSKSPDFMIAQKGETLKISWMFRLPEGMKTTSKFSHIHQLKGIDNKEGNADVSTPLITFTVRSLSNGKQQFQVIYTYPSANNEPNKYLAKIPLEDFLGRWVKAEETVTFDEKGEYHLVISDVKNGNKLVEINSSDLILWRDGSIGIRPKWGLYRNFGKDGSLKHLLRDECLKFSDFKITKQ